MGREVLGYIGKTAKDVSGIGSAERAFKQSNLHNDRGVYGGKGPFVSEDRDVDSAFFGLFSGIQSFVLPSFQKGIEDNGYKFRTFWKFGADLIVDGAIGGLGIYSGDGQGALIAKLGYNTLVQIAPDVANLAKGKMSQRGK